MGNELNTSVLVIGKSGAGKSSLLNYMFGENVEKTGVGRPVTEKGIYPHEYKHKDNFNINIYDTWGLEADKADEWLNLIKSEVEKHDKQSISEWFNTIIFCFNKHWSRVEDFEAKIIQYLLDGKNNIVVAITNCETEDLEENQGIVHRLEEATSITRDRIINISSVSEELIGGTITTQFGKDKIFGAIVDNLWASICGKLPKILKGEVSQNIDRERNKYLDLVNKNINIKNALVDKVKFLNKLSGSETMEKFADDVNRGINKFNRMANSKIRGKLIEANDYYLELYNCYNNQISIEQRREIHVNIKCDFLKDYRRELKGIITFNDLKDLKSSFRRLFELNDVRFIDVANEIGLRLRFNWKSVKEKRSIAIKTLTECFDELKAAYNSVIDERINNINGYYLMLQ